jgi:hypothetical protein
MYYIRQEYKPTRITGSSTTVVASGRSLFHSVHFNTTPVLVSVYDALSVTGTPIAIIGSGTLVGAGEVFDYVCSTGITITTASGACDITVAACNN